MNTIFMRKTLSGLAPVGQSKVFDKLKIGDEVEVTIKKPRNILFHRKFFGLLQLVFDNQEEFEDFETFRNVFIMRCGYYRTVETEKGVVWLPKSLSFSSMDEVEFEDLYDKSLDLAQKAIGSSREEILDALAQFY